MANITLWGAQPSLNTQKTAMMLTLCGLPFDFEKVLPREGQHMTAGYMKMNPYGRIPVMRHGDLWLRQTQTQIDYLARLTGLYLPATREEEWGVMDWHNFSTDYQSAGLARIRFMNVYLGGGDPKVKDHYRPNSLRGMEILEAHLKGNDWLLAARPTIADIIVYPCTRVLELAELDPKDWPATMAWLARFETLPGFRPSMEMVPE